MDSQLKKLQQILMENIESNTPDIILLDKINDIKIRLKEVKNGIRREKNSITR